MFNVLLIEDEPVIQMTIKRLFGDKQLKEQATLHVVGDLKSAEDIIKKRNSIDMILLDISLPDGDGIDFFCKIKNNPDLYPEFKAETIFLTGANDYRNVVVAFSQGANDFIKKPFTPEEFKARMIARLSQLEKKEEIKIKNLSLDLTTQKASVDNDGKMIALNLTKTEFKIIWYLAQRFTKTVSRENLLSHVWESKVEFRTIDTHISKLNRKLKDYEAECSVNGVYGTGYKLELIQKGYSNVA